MKTSHRLRGALLTLACLTASGAAADALDWLHPAALQDVPPAARAALDGALATWQRGPAPRLDVAAVLAAPEAAPDLRPSTARQLAAYLDWELAFARGEADVGGRALTRLVDSGCCAPGSAWQDYLALRAGYARRLALAPVARFAGPGSDDVWRAFAALAILETGATDDAATHARTLPEVPERCGERCAAGALMALVRGQIAFARAQRDEALAHARGGLVHLQRLKGAQRHLVPALGADLAVLFIALSDSASADTALRLGAETGLPPSHPFLAWLDATRFALLANDGETAVAAALLGELEARHGGALRTYALTAAAIGMGEGALGFMRAGHEQGLSAATAAMTRHIDARGDGAPAAAEALNLIALNESALDRNDDAIAHYRQALAIREAAFAPMHPLIAELTNNLSVVFHNIGRYDLAETYIARSLAIDRAFYGNDNEEVASDLSNLGAIYRAMGDAGRAIDLFREAVDINTRLLGRTHRRTAIMHHGLGQAFLENGDHREAYDSFATSVAIHRDVDAGSRNIPIGRHNLAKAAVELGEYALARDTLNEVLVRYAEIYGNEHRNVAAAYRDLARAQAGLGELDAADASLVTAAGLVARAQAQEVQWRIFYELAQLEERRARRPAAIFFGKLALEVLQELRASQTTLGRRLQRAFARQRADGYRQVALWLIDSGRLVEAQNVLAMLKDEEYFDFTRRAASGRTVPVPYGTLEARERERLYAARDALRADPDHDPAAYRRALSDVRAALARESDAPPPPVVAAAPPAGVAIVAYVVGDTKSRAIVVTDAGRSAASIDAGRVALGERVVALRAQLEDRDGEARTASAELYRLLIAPLHDTLEAADVTHLWLQLDDTLRYLPFAALYDGRRYLIERFALMQLHGGGAAGTAAPAAGRVAAFALTDPPAGFAALPGAAAEAERIVRTDADDRDGVFPGDVWTDARFTRDALRAALTGGYDMVHLASHFVFAPGNEKDSFLLLGDGERLSLYDWRNGDFPLDGVRLLTMSGCNTALSGRAADGREVDGFATLAAARGAQTILATLWPVDDAATADFMARFYALHAAGADAVDALKTTQAEFRSRSASLWAPFVLWGAAAVHE